MDVLAGRVHGMLLGGDDNEEEDGLGGSSSSSAAGPSTSSARPGPPASPASAPASAGVDEIRVAFDMWEDRRQRSDERREFGQIDLHLRRAAPGPQPQEAGQGGPGQRGS